MSLKFIDVPTYRFCFEWGHNFLHKVFFKVHFSYFLKNLLFAPSLFSSGTSPFPCLYTIWKTLWFSFNIFICTYIIIHIHAYTWWVFVIVSFGNFVSILLHFTFHSHQYFVEIPDSFNSCVVLYSVDVPFLWYNLYHLSVIHQLMSTLWVFALINHAVEKAMSTHSSTLAWTQELGRLQSLRVGQDWATSLSLFTFMHWRRKWQPIPVFLPGESQGRGSLVGCRLWGRTESDTTEVI